MEQVYTQPVCVPPIFTKAPPGMARSFAIRLAPMDVHRWNPKLWKELVKIVGRWLHQYLQNVSLPLLCGMVKMVRNDFEEAVVVVLTFQTGRPLQRVATSVTASLMRFAGPPVEGFAVIGDWVVLKWFRELNRHAQRRFGLGDAFATPGDIDVCEASRVLYGLGAHPVFLEDSKNFISILRALTPSEPTLALQDKAPECKHVWVMYDHIAPHNGTHRVEAQRTQQKKVLCALSRKGATALRDKTLVDMICDFTVGVRVDYKSCCEACGLSARTYCKCKTCLVIWCSSCLAGQRVCEMNRQQVVSLREEARALLRDDRGNEFHWQHQSQKTSTYYVTDVITTNEERAEWFGFELQTREVDAEDLPAVARLFLRFLGQKVKSNQQKAALKIFSLMGGTLFPNENSIRPIQLQESFARVWDDSVRLCYDCGGTAVNGACKARCSKGGGFTCATCGSSGFGKIHRYHENAVMLYCKNGHVLDHQMNFLTPGPFAIHNFNCSRHRVMSPWPGSVIGDTPTGEDSTRKRVPNRPT